MLVPSNKLRNDPKFEEGERMMKPNRKTDIIRTLNDSFRQTFIGGSVLKTDGVADHDQSVQQNLFAKVKAFDRFELGNDPYNEHDFGSIELSGTTFFWKIDYYDLSMQHGAVDPADPEKTMRVLTIMCADEY